MRWHIALDLSYFRLIFAIPPYQVIKTDYYTVYWIGPFAILRVTDKGLKDIEDGTINNS